MIDLQPAPVPELSEEWIASRRSALAEALPPRHHVSRRWVVLAGATGVAAVTASALVLVGGGDQAAFAGWSASPTAPAAGQLTTATSDCQARLADLGSATNKGADPAGLTPELTDVRGPFTVTVFDDATAEALCLSTPDSTNEAVRWLARASAAPVGPGAVAVDQVSFLAREANPYTLVVGRTGSGVTGVTLMLGNGASVTTTSGNGLFVAWWPGSESITSAQVATATGTSTQPLDLPGPGNPPATKSSPAPAGTQSSSGSSGQSTICLLHNCG